MERAGLAGKGITINGLRSAAISLYAARGLSVLETATLMGQADPGVIWKHYARLFDRSDVNAAGGAGVALRAVNLTQTLDTRARGVPA